MNLAQQYHQSIMVISPPLTSPLPCEPILTANQKVLSPEQDIQKKVSVKRTLPDSEHKEIKPKKTRTSVKNTESKTLRNFLKEKGVWDTRTNTFTSLLPGDEPVPTQNQVIITRYEYCQRTNKYPELIKD